MGRHIAVRDAVLVPVPTAERRRIGGELGEQARHGRERDEYVTRRGGARRDLRQERRQRAGIGRGGRSVECPRDGDAPGRRITASLGRLTAQEQKAVKTTAFDLQMDPSSPGLSFHKLDRAKDKDFWSVCVNADNRDVRGRTLDFQACIRG